MSIKFETQDKHITFFTVYQGVKVTLIRAKLTEANLNNLKELRNIALANLEEFKETTVFLRKAA